MLSVYCQYAFSMLSVCSQYAFSMRQVTESEGKLSLPEVVQNTVGLPQTRHAKCRGGLEGLWLKVHLEGQEGKVPGPESRVWCV